MDAHWLDQLLTAAVKNGASDIHIKAGSPPAFRITGRTQTAVWESLGDYDLRDGLRQLDVPALIGPSAWATATSRK
ncbi:MAG: hypothetical protein ABFS37_12560 [Acidobacteriota bacterium]